MVKTHSDSKRGNLLLPHGLLFPINSKGPTDRIAHTTAFVSYTPVVEHWLEGEICRTMIATTAGKSVLNVHPPPTTAPGHTACTLLYPPVQAVLPPPHYSLSPFFSCPEERNW